MICWGIASIASSRVRCRFWSSPVEFSQGADGNGLMILQSSWWRSTKSSNCMRLFMGPLCVFGNTFSSCLMKALMGWSPAAAIRLWRNRWCCRVAAMEKGIRLLSWCISSVGEVLKAPKIILLASFLSRLNSFITLLNLGAVNQTTLPCRILDLSTEVTRFFASLGFKPK